VKHEQVCQRGWFKEKIKRVGGSKKAIKGRKDKCDFYNQCTINVKPYGENCEELINMKLFSNGKIGFTGVKNIEDATTALELVLKGIDNLSGTISYFPKSNESGNPKNFRKKLKIRQNLLEYLSKANNIQINWNHFIDNINTKGKNPYPQGIDLPDSISYILCFMEIIMTYYEFKFDKRDLYNLINLFYQSGGSQYDPDKVNTFLEDIEIWKSFIGLIINNFRESTDQYSDIEFELIVKSMAAEGRYVMSLDRTIDFIRDYDLIEIQVILAFYLQTNYNYNLERIIDTLDKNGYSYQMIADIKEYLIIRGNFLPEHYVILYHFFVASREKRIAEMQTEHEDHQRQLEELDQQDEIDRISMRADDGSSNHKIKKKINLIL
ncbi:MAG: hypothetical protein WD512_07515, partial [Candidatus Paceibacterota bacterium]